MTKIDWRELYASNRAVIDRAMRGEGMPSHTGAGARTPARAARAARQGRRDGGGGRWKEQSFEGPGGARLAMVYTPPATEHGPAVPLVCMLHGCRQTARSFAAATRMNRAADRHGFIVVYPQQERSANGRGCWNWFLPGHQVRNGGEPASLAAVIAALSDPTSAWNVDRERVFVAGLSAGGAMAAVLAACYPELVRGLAVHSGLAYGAAADVGAAFATMARGSSEPAERLADRVLEAMGSRARAIPTLVICGSEDHTVAPLNADQLLEQWVAVNRRAGGAVAAAQTTRHEPRDEGTRPYTRTRWSGPRGAPVGELLRIEGLGHAWAGGAPGGSFADPLGPDATEAICGFFAEIENPSKPSRRPAQRRRGEDSGAGTPGC